MIREVKFGKENGPRPEAAKADFVLKSEVVELFDILDRIGNGVIVRIDVRHGLPCGMTYQEAVA